ncbi:MAG: hypothetical protein AAF828_00280 [Bacteroidota bacterium]
MDGQAPTLAVIDLGTNTFHLLIVQGRDAAGNFREIYRERRFVKLAEDGIETIGAAPYQRGLESLVHFRKIMDEHDVSRYQANGTAALRTATNGQQFMFAALEQANISINLISGDEEARLITKGVLAALPPLGNDRILIMDIGGGSVEFIIAEAEGTLWAQSFPVGVAVLKRRFHQQEPIGTDELGSLIDFLQTSLTPLWAALTNYPTRHLVGAAGTFDVIAHLMSSEQPTPHCHAITLDSFQAFYERCVGANLEERLTMPGLPAQRADLMVVALVLIKVVLTGANIQRTTVSNYAMKEGILTEMMQAK